MTNSKQPLRKIILESTGQDLRKCRGCLACDLVTPRDADISYGSFVQLILMNDEDILTSKMLWDDIALDIARKACTQQLNLQKVMLSLRKEKLIRENPKTLEQMDE